MSAYKELPSDNVSFRVFEANKLWTFTETDTTVVQVREARQRTGSYYYADNEGVINGSFIPARTLYDSIKHLYYNETVIVQYTGSSVYRPETSTRHKEGQPLHQIGSQDFTTGSAAIIKHFEPFLNFGPNSLKTYKMLGDRAVVISVPQERFGDGIKPGTVQVEQVSDAFTLYDDGYGNLYDNTYSASFAANKPLYTVGNVFYDHGNMVITATASAAAPTPDYQNFSTGSYIVKFKAIQKIYEMEAYCTAKAGEFNTPMNPSARVSRSLMLAEPLGFVTSSDFSSFVTTIGLYDDNLNLLAVGKTAQPIRNETDLALTFVVRLDW